MKIDQVSLARRVARLDELPPVGKPEIVLMGRSNVGKSSLINHLLNRKKGMAQVSRQPGKTRALFFYDVDGKLYLVDVPGLGYAKASESERKRWQRLLEGYLSLPDRKLAVLHLVDSRHPPTGVDQQVMAFMAQIPVPYAVVLTKSDKLSGAQQDRSLSRTVEQLHESGLDVPVILCSAQLGEGRKEIWATLREMGVLR